ncbi:hypothetical protein AWW66_24895 [Micromonospora rosaria]|uniref:STAS domain-containing protein n=1 Tax=Micromonospora rosaria TaxID=47874 RepID=A0A136PLP3_9ACTN|nr:MEDS domain-containing protein [Micromonospora rosaria]KXK59314.1 hypothetical protein AWW66_24895 [Micromonospora rosaria]
MIDQARADQAYGHVCWSSDDPAAFDSRAREFVDEGLAAGERVWYVTAGDPTGRAAPRRPLAGLPADAPPGAVQVVALAQTYRRGPRVDPSAQVDAYASVTEAALAAGYTGLRVVADVTPLVRTPAQLDAFARYEHLVDRYMRARPMSALCAYDRRELGDRAVAELACLHPETNAPVLFRLFAADPGRAYALTGELDPSNHELFRQALSRVDPPGPDGRLVLRAAGLRYIDHRCLLHLDDHARRHGLTVELRTAGTAAAHLVELLGLSRVRVAGAR